MKYLFAACILISCNIKRDAVPISNEALDTIAIVPSIINAQPLLFENAFVKGTKVAVDKSFIELYGINIGKLKLPTGIIVTCDPMHIDEYGIPFTQQFPVGEFPVQLAIARSGLVESIAFARINFSAEPVARWEFALQKDQKQIPLGQKKRHGYSVDAGVGIFIDQAAAKIVDREKLANMEAEMFLEMNKHYHNDWRYTMYNFGENNLAAFSTGFGDGYFSTYIGFDVTGKPCKLLTDFNVVEWNIKQ